MYNRKFKLWMRKESGRDLWLERFFKVFGIVTGIGIVVVTWHFSNVASHISSQNNDIQIQQRKSQIQPVLVILNDINYTQAFDEVVVHLRNIGDGPSIDLKVFVAINDTVLNLVKHLFTSVGQQQIAENLPGAQQDYVAVGHYTGRDWVKPEDVVEFRFSDAPYKVGRDPARTLFTFFLSFFDIDGNEYLTITKTRIGGTSALLPFFISENTYLDDSLLVLSKRLKDYQSITFKDISIRRNGAFKNFQAPSGSTQKNR